jgi:hypothetical protein
LHHTDNQGDNTMSNLMTRGDYLKSHGSDEERRAAHRKFYGQFVDEATVRAVVQAIGAEEIMASEDPHFNDIPLKRWDDVSPWIPRAINFKDVGDYPTQAGLVCVAKEAARQYKEAQ